VSGVAARSLPPQPSMKSDLSRVQGADVLLIFVESYGATTWDHPAAVRALAPIRDQFAADVRDTGRSVVSAFVESPTFGGGSWLAHEQALQLLYNSLLQQSNLWAFVENFRLFGLLCLVCLPLVLLFKRVKRGQKPIAAH
jgi:hypothetical protein